MPINENKSKYIYIYLYILKCPIKRPEPHNKSVSSWCTKETVLPDDSRAHSRLVRWQTVMEYFTGTSQLGEHGRILSLSGIQEGRSLGAGGVGFFFLTAGFDQNDCLIKPAP